MITVYFSLNIKTCCFGASRLDDAKLKTVRLKLNRYVFVRIKVIKPG